MRAGNVIGGGDWGRDRLIPDCIRALSAKRSIGIRNPHAVRPWQHVLESLSGYLWLGAQLSRDPQILRCLEFWAGRKQSSDCRGNGRQTY